MAALPKRHIEGHINERATDLKIESFIRLSMGIPGLDLILNGGLPSHRAYLVRGGPGTGKTTLGLHFLISGAEQGERCLFITLGETEAQIRRDAASLGFDLEGISFLDLSPTSHTFSKMKVYDIFAPSEVELEPTTKKIIERVETIKPERVFIDAMTQFRYLAPDAFQFRKEVLSFVRFMIEKNATVLFSSEACEDTPDDDLQCMSDGVITLSSSLETRAVQVSKLRGSGFHSGRHTLKLTTKGMEVFQQLIPEIHGRKFADETIPSGIEGLDQLLHGGLERGSVTLICGPSGVGKTTIALQFTKEASRRRERSAVYIFEETEQNLIRRCEAIKIPMRKMIEEQTLSIVPVEPLRLTPDEFAFMVKQEVEEKNTSIVILDCIAGYQLAIRGNDLISHLHSLSKYLRNMGATTLLINDVEAITGDFRVSEIGISYLSDNIVFLRYLELNGEIKRAVGVLKKRLSGFEKTLREVEIVESGIRVGKPLTSLRGILTGEPVMVD